METSSAVELLSDIRVGRLSPDDLRDFWPHIAGLIETACEHSDDRFTPSGCVERVFTGQWTAWLAMQGPEPRILAFVHEFTYPDTGKRVLAVEALGGAINKANEDVIAACNARLAEYARERAVDDVVSDARPGWLKRFPRAFEGAEQVGVILKWRI